MKRLLLFNLRTDVDDHILGFTTLWINALATHYDAIDVLTMHAGRIAVADNVRVYSAGRERGYSKPRRIAEFYRVLTMLLLRHRYVACFAHMAPLFAGMAGAMLTLRGIPTTLWYTHRQRTKQLELGTKMSRRVVTAVESSFPIKTAKLRPIGHGIDGMFFSPDERVPQKPGRIVYVARLTEIKNQHILLQATQDLDCEIVLVGDIPDGYDDAYKKQLFQLVEDLNITDKVIFAGAQTREQVRDWYQSASLAINLSPPGLFDKAALEAMACGLPVMVSNEAFAPVLGDYQAQLTLSHPEATDELLTKLEALLMQSTAEHRQMGHYLRQKTLEQHSLETLIARLVRILETGEA